MLCALGAMLAACGPGGREVVLHSSADVPERLSEWGILTTHGGELGFNDQVTAYELNMPLFSDYALKLRTVWMPAGTSARYADAREFDFPVGTIISKTFHYEKADGWGDGSFSVVRSDREAMLDAKGRLDLDDYVLIETRLLVRYEDGWRAFPYVWNEQQTDAILELAGDVREITLAAADRSADIVYVVPDANQCGGCHTPDHGAKELRPIGPKAWQLNREYNYRAGRQNQLEYWSAKGLLHGVSPAPPEGARWSQRSEEPVEKIARAYLDAYCAHCHNPKGAADTSALHLNIDAPVDRRYGVCKTPVAVGRGSGDRPYDIYPGKPEESILVFRLEHSDPAIAMPELGRSAVHAEGVGVVRDWIAGMNGDC